MKFFDALTTNDLARVQDLIEKAFDKVADSVPLTENVVADVSIRTTDTPVFHGLGRPIRGWIVVRSNKISAYCEGTASTSPSQFINLKANGANVVVTLLFF